MWNICRSFGHIMADISSAATFRSLPDLLLYALDRADYVQYVQVSTTCPACSVSEQMSGTPVHRVKTKQTFWQAALASALPFMIKPAIRAELVCCGAEGQRAHNPG